MADKQKTNLLGQIISTSGSFLKETLMYDHVKGKNK